MNFGMKFLCRKTTVANAGTVWPAGENLAAGNSRGDVLVAQGLPPKADLARLGQSWQMSIPTGSAFTHVAAWPTTRAELVLYNGEAAGGKSYVIDSVWAVAITSIAAASAYTLLGQIVPTGTAPTDNTACLITSRSGKSAAYAGNARRAVANTAFGVASQWEVLASVPAGPAASIGLAAQAELGGGWIVPPGGLLLVNVIAGTAAGTAVAGVVWHEVQLDLV